MPDQLASYISISAPIAVREAGNDRMREIEALEADNFELRDQVTRLKLHNATLRRMLEFRERRLPELSRSRPS
jgi:hypothetical protein